MKKAKRVLIISLSVITLLAVLAMTFAYTANFSEGERSGKIMKISKKGVFFKTYEGELDVGGITSGKAGLGSTWEFSLEANDTELYKKISDAMHTAPRVKLYYQEKFFKFPWRGDTKYFVKRIEVLDNEP
jgi:hypothetical protein